MSSPKNATPKATTGPETAADPLLQRGSFIAPTPTPSNQKQPQRPPKPSSASTNGEATTAADTMSWLPPGWTVEDRVRSSGATAGMVDKYYHEPVTGRRFRSKKEVLLYLETGLVKKKQKTSDVGTTNNSENSGSIKNKSGKNLKKSDPTFDYTNPPDSVTWALTDANEDVWTPLIGEEKVPELEQQKWKAAFAVQFNTCRSNSAKS